MPLTAEEKEKIMSARGVSEKIMSAKFISWRVHLCGEKPFTFITEQCKTPEQVEAAMIEKFNKTTIGLKLL